MVVMKSGIRDIFYSVCVVILAVFFCKFCMDVSDYIYNRVSYDVVEVFISEDGCEVDVNEVEMGVR